MNAATPLAIETNKLPIALRAADISCGAVQTMSTTMTITNQNRGRPEILIRGSPRVDLSVDSMTIAGIVWGS